MGMGRRRLRDDESRTLDRESVTCKSFKVSFLLRTEPNIPYFNPSLFENRALNGVCNVSVLSATILGFPPQNPTHS